MMTPREVTEYVNEHKVRELLHDILESILVAKPSDVPQYIISYLQSRGGGQSGQEAFAGATESAEPQADSESELSDVEDEEFNEDEVGELPEFLKNPTSEKLSRRSSICAEPMSAEAVEKHERKVFPKSDEERSMLEKIILKNVLFEHLDEDALSIVLDALQKREFAPGETIIRQGDDGDFFYIVDEGEAEVLISSTEGDGDGQIVKTCRKGDYFGELALMYNAPRAATVRAKDPVVTWALDRTTFKVILMSTTIEQVERREGIVHNIPILSTLNETERHRVIDALREVFFEDGDQIITEGDEGDAFYIIERGEVVCTQTNEGQQVELSRLGKGQYFGEVALLNNSPRVATVTAVGDIKCLKLDRKTFTRVMGALHDLLKRNMELYSTYHKV